MSLKAYRNKEDGSIHYAFEGEEHRMPHSDYLSWHWRWMYDKLPPNPVTILATSVYMCGSPQLDSLKSIYELDRQLNIEAEGEREDKEYQKYLLSI